ncbi:ion transporter [Pleurocapsa sp. FMAR1]|uniref:ion transporter n=1 Tax=Pleurocapsa sp. FMAR1 TaxID=3040204 RepID=UPI0029C795C8|nr:ion transporter [Pleurocapsa sp. FMAR1]
MLPEDLVVTEESKIKSLSLRRKIAFYLEDTETSLGLWLDLVILGLILLSSGIFVAQTYPISQQLQTILSNIDLIILIIFTIEYLVRCWSADNPQKYFFSFFGFIDLISVLPLLLGWINVGYLRIFRWFRILRIIRFWKIEKLLPGIQAKDSIVLIRIFLTLFTIIFVYAGLIYQVEYQINSDRLKNFFDALYFVVVTMTTVGYGDVTPLSQPGRVMTLLMIFTGVLLIPWQLSELIRQIVKSSIVKTSSFIEHKCSNCNLSRHDSDAQFCKQCGAKLGIKI